MTKSVANLMLALVFPWSTVARAQVSIKLEDYISEVKASNARYLALQDQIESVSLGVARADLYTPTSAFASAQLLLDEKLPSIPFFDYGALNTVTNSVGVEHTTSFGLTARLAYELDYYKYKNLVLDPSLAAQSFSLYDSRPVLSIEQSLWKNGFGRNIRLLKDQTYSQASADKLGLEAQKELLLIEAERAYYQLAAQRDYLRTQEMALEQTKAMYAYIDKRVRMNLMDKSDLLQAKAQMELESLEFHTAQNKALVLENEFNLWRGKPSKSAVDTLEPLETSVSSETIRSIPGVSLEYLATKAQTDVRRIQSEMSYDDTLPTLNLRSSFALNGRDDRLQGVLGDTFDSSRTTFSVGLMLTVPLDMRANAKIREASRFAVKSSEHSKSYISKQDATAKENLYQNALEAAQRLNLAHAIARTQRQKLEQEKVRLRQGRTTTYQVLLFERDLLLSDIRAVEAKLDWALIKSRLRQFNHEDRKD